MKIYLLMEVVRNHDDGVLMSAWTTRKRAEQEMKNLSWRETLGYFIVETELRA